jgi:hypothetical protein
MSPSFIGNAVEHALVDRHEDEERSSKSKQLSMRVHPSIYGLLERVALEMGKSPTGAAQMLMVSAVLDAAQRLGIDLDVELDAQELLFTYPWLFIVTDVRVIDDKAEPQPESEVQP